MALQGFSSWSVYPYFISLRGTADIVIGASSTFDGAGEGLLIVMKALEDMSINHIGFRCHAATGSPTATVSIQAIDADTGLKTGLWATNTSGTTATLVAGAYVLTPLTATATVPKGALFGVFIQYTSGTSFQVSRISNVSLSSTMPYAVNNTGLDIRATVGSETISLGNSATTFYRIPRFIPVGTGLITIDANNTDDAEYGVRFSLPFAARLSGLRFLHHFNFFPVDAVLRADNGTLITSLSMKELGPDQAGVEDVLFNTAQNLVPNTFYRLTIKPTTGDATRFFNFTIPSNDYISVSRLAANWNYTSFTTSGGWDDTSTQVPLFLGLILDQFSDDAGGGDPPDPGGGSFSPKSLLYGIKNSLAVGGL